MLWYKAWVETRVRFLLSLTGITLVAAFQDVYRALRYVMPTTPVRYFYNLLHFADDTMCVLWIAAVTLLAMGGLLREKAVGASTFTLTLPVSRRRLAGVRICVVFAEGVVMFLAPWIAILALIGTGGKPLLLSQAWFHIVLMASGGSLYVALPLLVSSVVEGEYTAPVVSFGGLMALVFAFVPSLKAYDPLVFMMGNGFFDRDAGMLRGAIPWGHAAVTVAIAGVLVGIGVKAIERREF